MSRLITSICLLAVMAAGCFWAVYIVDKRTDELSEMVSKTEKAYVDGNKEECVAAADELQKMWNDFIEKNIETFRKAADELWYRTPKNDDDLIYEWIKEINSWMAGYVSESVYKKFVTEYGEQLKPCA